MKKTSLILLPLIALTAGCGRPAEVKSVATAAMPIAVILKNSQESLQSRFAQQRNVLDDRANQLALQTAIARDGSTQIEKDWRFRDEKALPKLLAMLREDDDAIKADPLASLAPKTKISSKPAELGMEAINKAVKQIDGLSKDYKPSSGELFDYFSNVNNKLKELETEKQK